MKNILIKTDGSRTMHTVTILTSETIELNFIFNKRKLFLELFNNVKINIFNEIFTPIIIKDPAEKPMKEKRPAFLNCNDLTY